MKKIIVLIMSVLCLTTVCSACYIRELDTSRNYRYYPPESETTYEKLLSATGGQGDKWDFSSIFTITQGNKSVDDPSLPKDAYIQVLGDLKDLMSGKTLYGLAQPSGVSDYNAYAEDLLDKWPSEYKLWANFGAGETNKISDGELYLYTLRIIIPDNTKCYVIVAYRKYGDVDAKRYVYYSEDTQLISSINQWADKYIVAKSSNTISS
jgi:hypothetical protein